MGNGRRLIAVLAVCAVAALPERAQACSCSPEPLYRTIPQDGSNDVPLDIAPVLEGPFDASSIKLQDASGTAVEFTVASGPRVGCLGGWAELLPKQTLAPRTRYTIQVNALYPESLAADQRIASLSFTTGDSELPDEPLDRPQLSAASVMRDAPDCGGLPAMMACLGRVKPAEPGRVELIMRRGDEILLRTTHFIQSDSGFGLNKVPDCIELRRRAVDGRRSEPVQICGDALPVSDFAPSDRNRNGWVTCRDGLIGAAADNPAAAPASDDDAGIDRGIDAGTAPDAAAASDASQPDAAASDASQPDAAASDAHAAKPVRSVASGCTAAAPAPHAPADLWLLLAMIIPLAAARLRRSPR